MATERSGFRPDIEGLRGAAILLVVLFHAGVARVSGGFVGVDVFFVVSGYFITGMLVRQAANGSIDVLRFYGQRLLRLLPLLYLVVLATLASAMIFYAPIDRAAVAERAASAALSWGNIELANKKVDYFAQGENPLLHTWSLAVEVQFYLLWPLLLLGLAKLARPNGDSKAPIAVAPLLNGLIVVGAVSFAASVWLTQTAQPWAFFNLPGRIWEFALGGVLAICLMDTQLISVRAGRWLQIAGIVAIGIGVALFDGSVMYPGVAALLPAMGAVALIAGGSVSHSSAISDGLSAPPLRWLGRVSYAWYLWHWPLIGLAAAINPAVGVAGKLGWSAIALGLAWITHRIIEEPARQGRLSTASGRSLTIGALCTSCLVALIAYGAARSARRLADAPSQRMFVAAREDRMKHDCWATTVDEPRGACEFGDTRSSKTIVLLGDSHAEHWLGGLDLAGKQHGWKIVAYVKGGCPVADMPEMTHARRKRYYKVCARYREAMLQRIVAMRPYAVILSSWDHYLPSDEKPTHWQVTPDEWRSGLRRTYSRLTRAGLRTIAMRDVPHTQFDVPACLSRRAESVPFAQACEYDRATAFSRDGVAAQNDAARGLPVQLLDMNDQVCNARRCGVVRNGAIVFTDDNHLTATFSRTVAPVLGSRLGAALASASVSAAR